MERIEESTVILHEELFLKKNKQYLLHVERDVKTYIVTIFHVKRNFLFFVQKEQILRTVASMESNVANNHKVIEFGVNYIRNICGEQGK
jgi:hypothetical protein